MKICYFMDKWSWLANHSGYERVPEYMKKINPEVELFLSKSNIMNRFVGKLYSIWNHWPPRNQNAAANELHFSRYMNRNDADIYHILYYDSHYFMFDKWVKAPKNVVVTIHHPPARKMPELMKANLRKLSSAIILSSMNLSQYESVIGKGRVKFIPHGVDTNFFRTKKVSFENKRIIFAGQNGRNTKMLYRVITQLTRKYPELKFDLLVRKQLRDVEGLRQLQNNPNVSWRETISDVELRKLYNDSYLLLLPIDTGSANNTILEALACGVPVVTTKYEGVSDYGGSSIYPVVKNNDDNAMVKLVEKYLEDENWRNIVAKKQRYFAEKNLAWPIVAKKHLKAYKEFVE